MNKKLTDQVNALIKNMRKIKSVKNRQDFFNKNIELIKKSPDALLAFAKLTNNPVDGFEKVLSKSPCCSYNYLSTFRDKLNNNIIRLLEKSISKNAEYSLDYAVETKSRFEIAEATIAKDACISYCYAASVIGGRFELGEATIATDARYSSHYAQNVIHDRFELGEASIKKSAYYSDQYEYFTVSLFLKKAIENKTRISDKNIEDLVMERNSLLENHFRNYKSFIKKLILEDLDNNKNDIIEKYGDLNFFNKIICDISQQSILPEEISNYMIAQGLIDTNNKTYKKYIENYKKYKDKIKKILKKYQGKTVDELILILDKGE